MARLAPKDDDKKPRDVKGRHKSGQEADHENRDVALVGQRQDRIFAEKSTERWTTHESKGPGGKRQKCDGQIAREAAHFPDILLMMKHDDDATGSEEEQCLEKGMGK